MSLVVAKEEKLEDHQRIAELLTNDIAAMFKSKELLALQRDSPSPSSVTSSAQVNTLSSPSTSSVHSTEQAPKRRKSVAGESPRLFPCLHPDCSKTFTQLAHLKIHQRKHSGERPYPCSFQGCSKSFTQLGNLKTHERSHTGERPFKCSFEGCGKAFSQMGNCKTHEQLHLGVRPFVCEVQGCLKSFTQLGNLKVTFANQSHQIKVHQPSSTASSTSFEDEGEVKHKRRKSVNRKSIDYDNDQELCERSRRAKPSMEEKLLNQMKVTICNQAILNRK